MLADVLVHYDGLNQLYCNMANDKTLPLWGRQAANRARLKLDKHYSTTDTSNMYRLATGELIPWHFYHIIDICVVLHPSNRLAMPLEAGKIYLIRNVKVSCFSLCASTQED